MLNPYLIGGFVDNLVDGGSMAAVFRFSVIFASINVLRLVFNYITMIIYIKVQTRAAYAFCQDVISHVQKLSVSFVEKKDTNYLSQVVNGDTNQLIIFCITVLHSVILNALYIIMPLVVMFWLNARVTVVLAGALFVYILIYKLFQSPLFKQSMAFREKQNRFFAKLLEQLKFTRFIKIHVLDTLFRKQMDESFKGLFDESLKMQKLSFVYSALDTLVSTIVQISLFIFGGYLILSGSFTIGMFTIFTMYFNMMLGSVKYFFNFGKSFQDNMVSYSRLSEILSTTAETVGAAEPDGIHKIETKNLSFSYNDEDKAAVDSLNLTFTRGKIYALEGHNGAGKSTLVSLLMGLYINETKGEIKINDKPITSINMPFLRSKHIGIAEQEPFLLNAGAERNIFPTEEITQEYSAVSASSGAASELKLSELFGTEFFNIDALIKKQNSFVFSGGEKQKIAISRVLVKNPDLMIFDEPTSAMDAKSAEKFISHLQKLKQDHIVIIVTHDQNVKNACDEVVQFMTE